MIPLKIGTMKTVDMATGEVLSEKQNAFTMLPPRPDVCQVCAVKHDHDQPHNQQSIYYRIAFHAKHGRFPTWTDAMQHCTPEVQKEWRVKLVALMREKGVKVPKDLQEGREVRRGR